MAFTFNSSRAQAQSGDNWKKADSFLNITLNLPNGKKIKLGALKYYSDKKMDSYLMEMLEQEGVVDNLPAYVSFDYQRAGKMEEDENPFAFLAKSRSNPSPDVGF